MDILQFITDNFIWLSLALVVVVIFALAIIANSSFIWFENQLEKLSKERSGFHGTAYDFGMLISQTFFYGQVKMQTQSKQELRSAGVYSATNSGGVVTISSDLINTNSLAALAIVAHEFGHAYQHYNTQILQKHGKNQHFISKLGNLNIFLLVAALALGYFLGIIYALCAFALILLNFILAISFKYKTVRLENHASVTALKLIDELNVLNKDEISHIKKILTAAKRTYVADFIASMLAWTGLVKRTRYFDF